MIVDQTYWDNSYKSYSFKPLPQGDPTRSLIDKYIPHADHFQNAFEPGCYPGRFLLEIGRKGFILNGCDVTPRVELDLRDWLVKVGNCKVEKIVQENFDNLNDNKQYDLVCSFGFVEHFENYENIFIKQINMAKNGGIVLIQFPNFYGLVQRLLHYCLDRDNLSNHIISAMNIENYKHIIPEDFEIVFWGYYGNFEFWNDDFNHANNRIQKYILNLIYKTKRWWSIIPNRKLWSPYGAIILKKKL